jgi:excisionase family DNA binding protein
VTEPLFVTINATADLLGISVDLVRDLIHAGELPCAKFNRRYMVPRQAIDRVLAEALDGFDPAAFLAAVADADDAVADAETPPAAAPPAPSPRTRPALAR